MSALGCLLKKALTKVPSIGFEYRTYAGETTNAIGNTVATYSAWKSARGSVQPGLTHSFNARGVSNPGEIAKALGLDLSKNIITVFAYGINLRNVNEVNQPDQIRFDGKVFNVWSVSNWLVYDGWKAVICVEDTRERSAS